MEDYSSKNNMICPDCGGKLIERKGKYGIFIGCSNYPKCHYKSKNNLIDNKLLSFFINKPIKII